MFNYTKIFTFFLSAFFIQSILSQTLPSGVSITDIFAPFPGQRVTSLLSLVENRNVDPLFGAGPFQSVIAGGLVGEVSAYSTSPGRPLAFPSEVGGQFSLNNASAYFRRSLTSFPGRYVRQMAFDTATLDPAFFVVGKGGVVARYAQNRLSPFEAGASTGPIDIFVAPSFIFAATIAPTIITRFEDFPGGDARSIALDSIGRPVVGGKGKLIVRYNRDGTIGLTFQDFAPIAQQNNAAYSNMVNALTIDSNNRVIAVGRDGLVIRYSPNGQINRVYQRFPGNVARGIIVDELNRAYVCGDGGVVVRYSEAGTIQTRFERFPGLIARSIILLSFFTGSGTDNRIVVVGNSGSVVTYNSSGRIVPTKSPTSTDLGEGIEGQPDVPNIGSFVGIRATSVASMGPNFVVGGNRNVNTNGSMQQYTTDEIENFLTPEFRFETPVENVTLGTCSRDGANITVPAGVLSISGVSQPGGIIALFVNGQFVANTVVDATSNWNILRSFEVGQFRLEAVGFYNQSRLRVNTVLRNPLPDPQTDVLTFFTNFINLTVVAACP